MENQNSILKWQRELLSFKGIKSTFIIEGNINDRYISKDPETGEICTNEMKNILESIFASASNSVEYDLIFCDPILGFEKDNRDIVRNYQEIVKNQRKERQDLVGLGSYTDDNMVQISEIVRALITDSTGNRANPKAVVVNFTSRLITNPESLAPPEVAMFLNLLFASQKAKSAKGNKNTLVLIADKISDIPAWFYMNNPNIRTITVPNPDRAVRETYINNFFESLNADNPTIAKVKKKFTDITEGMKLIELDELRRLFERSNMPVEEVSDIVAVYKFGFRESQWEKMRERIGDGLEAKIASRVMGQDQAIKKITEIIKRSVTGLSGMQHSSSENKPRGIMFLAGPTGTGKTEVVKTVAELLFSDEKALIRFDMSEYEAEQSDQKLFGAPPGYAGYYQGGQLTNAVKANPFAVLLFDEIEKAHPTIMDKFLQILEDGRMTDGQGNTVYFSETLIFFTSNEGITKLVYDNRGHVIGRELNVSPGFSYDKIEKAVKDALQVKFKPEVLNRIGKNIIVFNYIDEKATDLILKKQLQNITHEVKRKNEIELVVEESAMEYLRMKCLEDETRVNGGRGIGNIVESEFLNPLAVYVFDAKVDRGSAISATSDSVKINFTKRGGR